MVVAPVRRTKTCGGLLLERGRSPCLAALRRCASFALRPRGSTQPTGTRRAHTRRSWLVQRESGRREGTSALPARRAAVTPSYVCTNLNSTPPFSTARRSPSPSPLPPVPAPAPGSPARSEVGVGPIFLYFHEFSCRNSYYCAVSYYYLLDHTPTRNIVVSTVPSTAVYLRCVCTAVYASPRHRAVTRQSPSQQAGTW